MVRRLPRVYPVYRRDLEAGLAGLRGWMAGQDRLIGFGRQGLFVPDNTHHVLATGWEAADCVQDDGTFDRARWESALVGFADHVVED